VNPFKRPVFTFKRIVEQEKPDITAVWTMNQYASTRTSLSVQISPEEIALCQGMAVYSYSFPSGRNTIKLEKVKNTCPSE
jgi:hypothetical protein